MDKNFTELKYWFYNVGSGEVCHDKIVQPNICFMSWGCQHRFGDFWENLLTSALHNAGSFGCA